MNDDSKPVLKKRRWPYPLVWLVPLLVAVACVFYWRAYLSDRGPVITIQLGSAEGLRVGETPLMHRGVAIGQLSGIELSENHRTALAHVRLERNQQDFAKEGASFWIVRPEVSVTGLEGLGTLISGPYIDSSPGKHEGEAKKFFSEISKPPEPFKEGLNLIVHAPALDHLQDHSPVYYRGIQVGTVKEIRIGPNADRVEARIVVWRRYSPLVRVNSKFWAMTGFDAKGGIFSGVTLKLESLKALVSGALEFATPDNKDMGDTVREGTDFALEKEEPDKWREWMPKIPIKPGSYEADEREPPQMAGRGAITPMSERRQRNSAEAR